MKKNQQKKYKVYRINKFNMNLCKGLENLKIKLPDLKNGMPLVKHIWLKVASGIVIVVCLGLLLGPGIENTDEDTISVVSVDTNKIISDWNDDLEEKGYVQGIDFAYDATNKNIDLEKVLKENPQIRYVIVRSNYFFNRTRKAGETDAQYKKRCLSYDNEIVEYAKIAKKHGVAFSIYYWPTFRGLEKTQQEIDIVMKKVKELEKNNCHLTLPIFMDIEAPQDGGGDLCRRISRNHKETIDCFKYTVDYFKNNGYKLMLYTGNNTKDYGVHDLAQKQGVDLWVSHYGNHNNMNINDSLDKVNYYKKSPHLIRQYSEGKVNGFNGSVDLNLAYKNIPEEIVENELNNTDEIEQETFGTKIKKFFKNIF